MVILITPYLSTYSKLLYRIPRLYCQVKKVSFSSRFDLKNCTAGACAPSHRISDSASVTRYPYISQLNYSTYKSGISIVKKLASATNKSVSKCYSSTMNPLWKPQPPAKVGDSLNDVRTPALLVDLDVLESNMRKMSKIMESYPNVAVRPHVKAHKAPAIGKMQMENGCVGLCSQTLTETQAMVYGGGGMDILLSNQCIGKHKLRELVALVSAGADIALCVDDADNARDASEVAAEAGVNLKLVVEVNVGQERCGVEPGQPAADLAKVVMNLPNVTFKGIQCYNGWNQHIRSRSDCQAAVDKVVELTKLTLKALSEAGIACDYVTGGGTGTFRFEAGSGVFTEVQPGSYIFMDVDYWRNESASGGRFEDFGHSLLVLTTVQSVCPPRRAVCDAGMKATSLDSGPPLVRGRGDLTYSNGGDEHGILNPAGGLTVGDRLFLIPGHCDPTVNLYDWIVAMRGERVEAVWPVLGRGPGV